VWGVGCGVQSVPNLDEFCGPKRFQAREGRKQDLLLYGLGVGIRGSGFRGKSLGFGVQILGFRVESLGFRV